MNNNDNDEKKSSEMPVEEWLAIRKEAGLRIDPETCEVDWWFAQTLDPYGVYPDLPEECDCVGREYFARAPDNDTWVNFGDLPEATATALWGKYKSRLALHVMLKRDTSPSQQPDTLQ